SRAPTLPPRHRMRRSPSRAECWPTRPCGCSRSDGDAMLTVRIAKIAMVASIAAFATLVAFGNITDYGTNLVFVQHVLSMDSLFPNSTITYRAITSPTLHHAAYAMIIAAEALIAMLCWAGALALLRRRHAGADQFNHAKAVAVAGLALGFLTWQFGF